MGHQTVQHVPRTYKYAEAKARHDEIKPIRNLAPERRPLGQRRDHHTYWVRMDGDTVQYMVYKTPVVSFMSDGAIEIRNGNYSSVTTHGFIMQVLGYANIRANSYGDKTKLEVGKDVLLLGSADVARLVWGEDGKLRFDQEVPDQYQYAMNRKAANNVKARYKEFADYFYGFLNLRTVKESYTHHTYTYGGAKTPHTLERETITVPITELVEVLGTTDTFQSGSRLPHGEMVASNVQHWGQPASSTRYTYAAVRRSRQIQEKWLLELVSSDQPEETKHLNFYKAALALTTAGRHIYANDNKTPTMLVHPETTRQFFKFGLMMAHAKEVLTLTKLPPGRVPHKKYMGWVIEEGEEK